MDSQKNKPRIASVAVSDVAFWLDKPYDYRVPDPMLDEVQVGMRVRVPFSNSNRKAEGVILALDDMQPEQKLKPLLQILDSEPALTEKQLKLAYWMRERFFCTVYDAVRVMLPAGMWFDSSGKRRTKDLKNEFLSLAISRAEAAEKIRELGASAKHQSKIIQMLIEVDEVLVSDVRAFTGAPRSSINALIKQGVIAQSFRDTFRRPVFRRGRLAPLPTLNEKQQSIVDALSAAVERRKTECGMLYGVTGSGKTAVYVNLISQTLKQGDSAILLVPEIALTPQMLETFSSHFGDVIAVLHSSLSMAERYDEWKRVREGRARLVIGTRSAIFAPVSRLGLIIIDEEQEESYKSESTPRYSAKDVAKYLCAQEHALLLLGSATPSLESMYAAKNGRYRLFELPERFNRMPLPEVSIVDMKSELRSGNMTSISAFLKDELEANIKRGEQSILFLNRRGASKLITCSVCGYTFKCPNCSVSLTYHSSGRKLVCHYCGHTEAEPKKCPECSGTLTYTGDGTQKVEEQLTELFPNTGVIRMDADTVALAGSHDALLERFSKEKIPIMVGTQMVTKGLNFEDVTLVGVLSADQSLYAGDFRASERTFSLITQVIGRSGRANRAGRAVIQTFTPDNQVICLAAKQDYMGFYEYETALRRLQGTPPFSHIFVITFSGKLESSVLQCASDMKQMLSRYLSGAARVLGPAPYPVVRVNRFYRYRITVLAEKEQDVRKTVAGAVVSFNNNKQYRDISVYGDIDPNY